MPKKSKLLETMKPEQKFRVDLEQISLGCHGPWLTDPRFYQLAAWGAQNLVPALPRVHKAT